MKASAPSIRLRRQGLSAWESEAKDPSRRPGSRHPPGLFDSFVDASCGEDWGLESGTGMGHGSGADCRSNQVHGSCRRIRKPPGNKGTKFHQPDTLDYLRAFASKILLGKTAFAVSKVECAAQFPAGKYHPGCGCTANVGLGSGTELRKSRKRQGERSRESNHE